MVRVNVPLGIVDFVKGQASIKEVANAIKIIPRNSLQFPGNEPISELVCVCVCATASDTHRPTQAHIHTHTLSPPAHILVSLAQEALGNRPYSKKFVCHDIGNKSLIGEINDRVALAVVFQVQFLLIVLHLIPPQKRRVLLLRLLLDAPIMILVPLLLAANLQLLLTNPLLVLGDERLSTRL